MEKFGHEKLCEVVNIAIHKSMALGFAGCAHRKQVRKYTGVPYITHCKNVVDILEKYINDPAVLAAAALHDTLEDTDVTQHELCMMFGLRTVELVLEVTDASKPSDGNRAARKKIDLDHLARSSYEGASIKLADMIDNTESIVKYDPNFAKIYLPEKSALLQVLQHGHPDLWKQARDVLQRARFDLGFADEAANSNKKGGEK